MPVCKENDLISNAVCICQNFKSSPSRRKSTSFIAHLIGERTSSSRFKIEASFVVDSRVNDRSEYL